MAYILKAIGDAPNILYKHFECDNTSDLSTIDVENVLTGSTCYVINTDTLYTLNSNNEWKIRSEGGNSGGGSTGGSGGSGGEEWETLYDTGTEGVTVDMINKFEQTLNKTQDRYKEYRITLCFSKDTSDETTGNKTVNIYVDGYTVSYYQISLQENYIKNVYAHIYPAAPAFNGGNLDTLFDTFCLTFASEPAGHLVDKCSLCKAPTSTNGKLTVNILSPYSGTISCCVQGKK